MDWMPDELLLRILAFLEQHQLCGLALVSRRWLKLVYDRTLWKNVRFPFSYRDGHADAVLEHLATRIDTKRIVSMKLSRASGKNLNTIMKLFSSLQELTLFSFENVTSYPKQRSALAAISLTKLVIDSCELTDDDAGALAVCCTQLEHLELKSSKQNLTDAGVIQFATKCHCLRHVWIVDDDRTVSSVTASCIAAFGLYCRKLQYFHVCIKRRLGNDSVSPVVISNPVLEHLYFHNLIDVTDAGIVDIANSCTKLRELFLYHCNRVSDVGIIALANSCRDLPCFEFTGSDVTDVGTHSMLQTCRHIEHLVLPQNTSITDDTLISVAHCLPRIKHLDMSQCSQISQCGVIAVLRHCRRLETCLFLACESIGQGKDVTDLEYDLAIAKVEQKIVSRLSTLNLILCKQLDDGSLYRMVRLSPSIRTLILRYCRSLTDDAMKAIALHCPDLERLTITGCNLVTNAGLRQISNCCCLLRCLYTPKGDRFSMGFAL